VLLHESEAQAEIAQKYRVQLDAMTKLHDTVVSMMTAGEWRVQKTRGVNPLVAQTMMGLLTKAMKTFRSIQILCERGLYDDASALARVLLETTVAIAFILQKKSKQRMLMYHAYGMVQSVKMLNEWAKTKGLKRKATKAMMKQANDGLATYMSKLPAGTNLKRHWCGLGSIQEAMSQLRGGDAMYATLYRHTSAISHASDFGGHFSIDDSGEMVWEVFPQVEGFEAPSYVARQLLFLAAQRIDERFGLGYAAALAPFQLTRTQMNAGQI
jgi:hypothetical protein